MEEIFLFILFIGFIVASIGILQLILIGSSYLIDLFIDFWSSDE
jgi:hypothetical protein